MTALTEKPARATLQSLCDRIEITELLNGYAYGIDLRDWIYYRSIFTDPLTVDVPWTGVVATMGADAWVTTVCANLASFDATQHRMTNIVVALDGDHATLRAQVTARHTLAGDSHVIGGYYVHDLVRSSGRWKIAKLGLVVTWEEGDRGLWDRAAALGPRARSDVLTQGMQYNPQGATGTGNT